jgi:hypothetical protein
MMRAARLVSFALVAVLPACSANPPPPAGAPQAVVPGSEAAGVTERQAAAVDEDVVHRLAWARCDRSQSCNRIGPGAQYATRAACIASASDAYRKELNEAACPGGIGESGLAQCERSLRLGECTEPGQTTGTASHCRLASLCLK